VAVSIACFRPIDTFFKKRILRAAEKIRINHPHLIVIGITGSVGKTTTKELLAHILTPYGAIATPEHVNSEIGVARWFTQKISTEPADSKKIVIVEMGAYKKGEIANICTVVKPQFGILTYIGTQHLGLFGGIEEIKNAKSELLEALPQSGIAFVNSDSKHIQEVMNRIHCHTVAIGTDHRAMIQAIDIEETGAGVTFTIGMHRMALPLAGTHMITNALLAIVVAEKLGIERSIIREALRSFQGFDHTFARREERGITLLDNTFSASVESTMAAIEWARTQPHTEKTLIFSGILELGDEEERLHLLIAERAKTVFDHIILTQPNTVQYFSTLTSEKTELYSIETKRRSVGSLLVCMGRMPKKTIESLLPPVS
jgi:UDP-N-acetylmuramoyl-tripeptide--D-alanyl-D-alanine ligase